ncbi:MAG TPA: hypothetical protein VF618_24940 [Thermoanaerobaculia bacterium]
MTKRSTPSKKGGRRSTSKFLLKYRAKGTLSWPEHDLPIRCVIAITQDGSITISTGPVTLNRDTFWILENVPDSGRLATWARLRATTKDGLTIESDHVIMTGRDDRLGPQTSLVTLRGHLSTLSVHHRTPPPTAAKCLLVYHTIGMQGFGVQHATTSLGIIRMAGSSEIPDHDHLAGRIQITAPDHELKTIDEWTNEADEHIAHVLLIISLAEGKLLEWSIRESATSDGKLFRTDFYGPKHTGTPRDGIGHFLNLQPILDLATTRYTEDLRSKTGIELAIRLLLAQPAHAELQLVTAMTALEHLTSIYNKQTPVPPPVPLDTFSTIIRPALEAAFDNAIANVALDPEGARLVRNKMSGLNNTVLKHRLDAMLRDYDVPIAGLEKHVDAAIRTRNDIIHKGTTKAAFPEFYLHVAVLREVLKRIILTLLEYKGQYISFLNGQEFREFPPTKTTIQ